MGQLWDRLHRYAKSQMDFSEDDEPSQRSYRRASRYADFDNSTRNEFEAFDRALHGDGHVPPKEAEVDPKHKVIVEALRTLGVPAGPPLPSYHMVKTAYRKLMKEYHPDRYREDDPNANHYRQRAAEVNAAWEAVEHILPKKL